MGLRELRCAKGTVGDPQLEGRNRFKNSKGIVIKCFKQGDKDFKFDVI